LNGYVIGFGANIIEKVEWQLDDDGLRKKSGGPGEILLSR
jgi:hypothetical protein